MTSPAASPHGRARTPSVLVAYDGSETARRALLHAAELVGPGETLTVVNVVPAQSVSARLETISDAERRRQRRLLREAEALLRGRGVAARTVDAAGDPTTEILAAAERTEADILVVGRHASHRIPRHASVSAKLVRRATCDVLVVH